MTEEAIAKDFTGTTGVRREPEASLEGDDGAPPDAAVMKRCPG
jgi:hypothetical protein